MPLAGRRDPRRPSSAHTPLGDGGWSGGEAGKDAAGEGGQQAQAAQAALSGGASGVREGSYGGAHAGLGGGRDGRSALSSAGVRGGDDWGPRHQVRSSLHDEADTGRRAGQAGPAGADRRARAWRPRPRPLSPSLAYKPDKTTSDVSTVSCAQVLATHLCRLWPPRAIGCGEPPCRTPCAVLPPLCRGLRASAEVMRVAGAQVTDWDEASDYAMSDVLAASSASSRLSQAALSRPIAGWRA